MTCAVSMRCACLRVMPSRACRRASCSCGLAVHDENAIEAIFAPGFDQQRNGNDDVWPGGRVATSVRQLTNRRMRELLQPLSFRGIGEHPFAQRGAIQAAVLLQHLRAEMPADLVEQRRAGRHDFARQQIRVDEGDAQRHEQVRDGALAAGYSAGEPDAEPASHYDAGPKNER